MAKNNAAGFAEKLVLMDSTILLQLPSKKKAAP